MGERCGAGTHPTDKPEEERNELLGENKVRPREPEACATP